MIYRAALALFGSIALVVSFRFDPRLTGYRSLSATPMATESALYNCDVTLPTRQVLDNIDVNNARRRVIIERSTSERCPEFNKKLVCEWTYNSCALDGSSITLQDTEYMLNKGLSVAGLKVEDVLGTLGYSRAIDLIYETARDQKSINKCLVHSLHRILTEHVKSYQVMDLGCSFSSVSYPAGEYRKNSFGKMRDNGSTFMYSSPEQLEEHTQELFNFCSNPPVSLHPVVAAALAHCNFMRIRPYAAGSGKIACLLMNYVLIRAGYSPAVRLVTDWRKYDAVLQQADEGDSAPFVHYIAECTSATIARHDQVEC